MPAPLAPGLVGMCPAARWGGQLSSRGSERSLVPAASGLATCTLYILSLTHPPRPLS
jgi:hypothetical protein